MLFRSDEPLAPASFLGIPNFIVDDLTHLVSLAFANTTFGADYKTVCLFTVAPLTAGTQYRLTVNNVAGVCGNPVAANSQLDFNCPSGGGPKLNFMFTGGSLCLAWTGTAVLEVATSLSPLKFPRNGGQGAENLRKRNRHVPESKTETNDVRSGVQEASRATPQHQRPAAGPNRPRTGLTRLAIARLEAASPAATGPTARNA